MEESSELEARVGRLEARVEEVAADAAAARHLAAARDRDLADLTLKVDANRRVISALGEHTRGGFEEVYRRFGEVDRRFGEVDRRFDQVDRRFDAIDAGFIQLRGRLDGLAAGQQAVVELLTTLIDREPPPSSDH
jgi:hypothetical protein